MKTKTIFKTLALAMLMPAMLLTTACSSDDNAVNNGINNNENTAGKGYALPVTINVTRGGDATTRATYNETDKVLEFSAGDQLFVTGTDGTAGAFAGTLTWTSGDTFSGTLYTANSYSGTAVALLTSASTATATLLPDGYDSFEYLTVSGDGYSATLTTDATKAFATSKAAAVEQLSLEQATTYSSGFALAPQNAIINFTVITGTEASSTDVSLQVGSTTISGSVTSAIVEDRATATFAMAVASSTTANSLTVTVAGTEISLGSHALTAGKIYSQKLHNINGVSTNIQANEKWIVYGTGEATSNQITIADGATVTLDGVTISGSSYCIKCAGSATIILKDGSTNTLTGTGSDYPALWIGDANTTLTIQGSTGALTVVQSGDYCAGIGGGYSNTNNTCGNIRIEGGVITVQGGYGGAGIGTDAGGPATCGDIIITGGTITANGGGKAAGIGGGTSDYGNTVCGNITIANTVTKVTATAGNQAPYSIGKGYGSNASCGTVTIGGVEYPEGTGTPFTYPVPATGHALSASEVGEIVCSDGLAYAAADKDNLPTGVTAVAIVAYLGDGDTSDNTYNNGLAIAMSDANDGSSCGWGDYFVSYNCVSKSNDIATAIGYKDGISSTNTLTSDGHYHEAATAAASNNGTAAPTGTSGWFLPSMGQWNLIVQGLASKKAGSAVTTDISTSGNDTYTASNLNSVITDAGGTGFNGGYQSSTQYDSDDCWHMNISEGRASNYVFYAGDYVRSVLAF